MITKVPAIVNVCICMLINSPVKVTVKPAGIVIEQTPDGICPLVHVAASLNAPDLIAIKIVLELDVVESVDVVVVTGTAVAAKKQRSQ